jgi:hypothetical protein
VRQPTTWSLGSPETAEQRFQGLVSGAHCPFLAYPGRPQVSATEASRCDELEADHPACTGLRTSMQSTPGTDNWATRPGAVVRNLCSEPSEPPQIVRGFRDHPGCARIGCMPLSTRGARRRRPIWRNSSAGPVNGRSRLGCGAKAGQVLCLPPHEQSGSAWRTRSMSSAAKG